MNAAVLPQRALRGDRGNGEDGRATEIKSIECRREKHVGMFEMLENVGTEDEIE